VHPARQAGRFDSSLRVTARRYREAFRPAVLAAFAWAEAAPEAEVAALVLPEPWAVVPAAPVGAVAARAVPVVVCAPRLPFVAARIERDLDFAAAPRAAAVGPAASSVPLADAVRSNLDS
jgi:hypothetical protein